MQRERVVDLFLISDGKKQHYCVVKSLSRLLASEVSNTKWKIYICRRCLNFFDSEDKLCLLYTSPSPRDRTRSRMPSSA